MCAIVAGHPDCPAHVVHRDERHIAFLNRWTPLRGYCLLAPVEHREDVVRDVSLEEHLALHHALYALGKAVEAVVPTERLYVLSLGSREGNRHLHWHIAPLPPGSPYERQQYAALDLERASLLDVGDKEQDSLAARIAAELEAAK